MSPYQEKANEIIKESIKSAIFIDENARNFFDEKTKDTLIPEEEISVNLYLNFKKDNISLDIHKYESGQDQDADIKNLLFTNKDLVLLDWKLDHDEGEEQSLGLLADIVNKRPHIHFVAIYTNKSGDGLDLVFENILSYFSEKDESYFIDLESKLDDIDAIEIISSDLRVISFYRDDDKSNSIIGKLFKDKGNRKTLSEIKEICEEQDTKCALINASIAISENNPHKSKVANPCPDIVSFENKTLVINNTIITILNKSENKPDDLISNFSNQITKQNSSYTQLLGLEMQNILSSNSSFIDSDMIKVSKDAFIKHRNNYRKESIEHLFPEFVKNVMLEKVKLTLQEDDISLLDNDFLDNIDEKNEVNRNELISMNVFYNSIKSLIKNKKLGFGDVFSNDKGEYYICITAPCDTLRPDKIDNIFYFAKGQPISNMDIALELSDSAFISFISNDLAIAWSNVDIVDKNEDTTEYIKKLKEFLYKPVYIKPLSYLVSKPELEDDNTLGILRAHKFKGEDEDLEILNINYLTTIKENYTQRIANHAFAHPVRVGVEFVKNS